MRYSSMDEAGYFREGEMSMGETERYIVAKMDGTTVTVLADTFEEVVNQFGENEIWQITKLFYRGGKLK